MKMARHADVDDVHLGVGNQFTPIGGRPREAELFGGPRCEFVE